MFFSIDPANGVAIYEQVARQVIFAVAAEALRPKELVPSVRELARQLAINPNTVARAYRQLQDNGILEAVRGTGLAVAEEACSRCQEERLKLVRSRIHQVLVEAKQSRLDWRQLQAVVEAEIRVIEREEI
jgi:GntR family transcriptional regulator